MVNKFYEFKVRIYMTVESTSLKEAKEELKDMMMRELGFTTNEYTLVR